MGMFDWVKVPASFGLPNDGHDPAWQTKDELLPRCDLSLLWIEVEEDGAVFYSGGTNRFPRTRFEGKARLDLYHEDGDFTLHVEGGRAVRVDTFNDVDDDSDDPRVVWEPPPG